MRSGIALLTKITLLAALGGCGAAHGESRERVYTHWDASLVIVVRGEWNQMPSTVAAPAKIWLKSAPDSFQVLEHTRANGSTILPGKSFEIRYQFIWGGVSVAGEPQTEPKLAFRLKIEGGDRKCYFAEVVPTKDQIRSGLVIFDIGKFYTQSLCNELLVKFNHNKGAEA